MWYLISQTAVFILIAGLIGFWLGWYLGKLSRQSELDLYQTRLQMCQGERDADKAEIKSQKSQVQVQSEKLSVCEAARKQLLTAQNEHSNPDLDEIKSQLQASEKQNQESATQIVSLEQRLNDQTAKLAECEAQHVEQNGGAPDATELADLNKQLAEAGQTEDELKSRIQQLEHQTLEQAKLLDACESARVEQTAEIERSLQQRNNANSGASNTPLSLSSQSDAQGQNDADYDGARPATLLSEPEGTPDNLQRIKGVGPRLESLLHELGVYHFRQIAEFSTTDIAWVNDRLSFKGRIEREKWVEQAQAFLDE